MRRLLPTPTLDIALRGDVDLLAEHYAYPSEGALRANMVASVDGAISLGGRSQPISGQTDWFLFGLQRALADVIVVGAGTARSEGYGPGRARQEFAHLRGRAGQPPAPSLAIVTASADIDPEAEFLRGDQRAIVATCATAPPQRVDRLRARAEVVVVGDAHVDLAALLAALCERGQVRILTEGGPSLLGSFVAGDLIDEVVATITPALVGGDAGRMVTGAPGAVRGLELTGLLEDDGALFAHYRRTRDT